MSIPRAPSSCPTWTRSEATWWRGQSSSQAAGASTPGEAGCWDEIVRCCVRIICYLTGVLLAFLVLIGVIVVLTLMIANKELGIVNEVDF